MNLLDQLHDDVLCYIRDQNDIGNQFMTVKHLRNQFYVSQGTMCEIVKSLKESGYITKIYRGGQKFISDKGRRYLSEKGV